MAVLAGVGCTRYEVVVLGRALIASAHRLWNEWDAELFCVLRLMGRRPTPKSWVVFWTVKWTATKPWLKNCDGLKVRTRGSADNSVRSSRVSKFGRYFRDSARRG